jgi:hypothetical protein
VRHVPRQSSAANLASRVQPADVKRMAAELEALRQDNKRLRLQLELSGPGGGAPNGAAAGPGGSPLGGRSAPELERRCRQLELEARQQVEARRGLEQQVAELSAEMSTTRTAANQLISKFIMEQQQQQQQQQGSPRERYCSSSYGSGLAERLGLPPQHAPGPAAGAFADPRSLPGPTHPPAARQDASPRPKPEPEPAPKRQRQEGANGTGANVDELLAAAEAARAELAELAAKMQ